MRRDISGGTDISDPRDIPMRTCFSILKACPFTWNRDSSGGGRYLAWTTRVTGTTIIHVNALYRDISGGRDNFDCNAHDQYSQMEANIVEIAGAKCEHAQYARRNPFNWCRTTAKRESIEKTDKRKFLFNTMHLVHLKYNFATYCYYGLK